MNVDTSMMLNIVGLVWIFLFAEWLDILYQFFASKSDLLPADLNLGQRDAVRTFSENLRGQSLYVRRTRSLLGAWSQGWNPREIIELAAQQSNRSLSRTAAIGFFLVLVMAAGLLLNQHTAVAAIGIAVVGGTIFMRILLLGRIDARLERDVIAKLPANIPATAMTAAELATALGASIESAFKNYVPNPEKMAKAINDAIENANKAASGAGETILKKVRDEQNAAVEKWAVQAKEISSSIAASQKGLEQNTAQLQNAIAQQAKNFDASTSAWQDKLKTALGTHADNVEKANKVIADQLAKIMTLEKEIQQVLHIQQVVDGTLKSVTATEEFKQTLAAIRTHLQESDKTLKELARPKVIRLVETEGEVSVS